MTPAELNLAVINSQKYQNMQQIQVDLETLRVRWPKLGMQQINAMRHNPEAFTE